MPRTFAYARVSTAGQTPENQTREIATAGFDIPAYRQATEVISGGVPAVHRPGFAKLIVTNFGRLGATRWT